MSMISCPNKSSAEWQELIKHVSEQRAYYLWNKFDGNVPKSEYTENIVNSGLKAFQILQSDKGKQVFDKGLKNNWDLNKILTELAVPKEQKQLLLDLNISDREQLALELANQYSYTVEVNTAIGDNIYSDEAYDVGAESFKHNGWNYVFNAHISIEDLGEGESLYTRWKVDNNEVISENITKEEYDNVDKKRKYTPTQIYSNLTVPGGTNYTENEIATPAITPSIKGHAQFSTDQGIGWFRSDEQILEAKTRDYRGTFANDPELGDEYLFDKFDQIGGKKTKTRRILEVQSDWGQKQRKFSDPDINIKYDIQQIINDLQKSGDLKIDCN